MGGWGGGGGGGAIWGNEKRQIYSHSNLLSYSVPVDLGQSRPDSLTTSSKKCRHSHNLKCFFLNPPKMYIYLISTSAQTSYLRTVTCRLITRHVNF